MWLQLFKLSCLNFLFPESSSLEVLEALMRTCWCLVMLLCQRLSPSQEFGNGRNSDRTIKANWYLETSIIQRMERTCWGQQSIRKSTCSLQVKNPKEVFWLPISSSWYEAATEELKDLKLKKCHSGTCLPGTPKVVFGSKASTSDFYVKNKAYGDFLVEKFNVSTADSASASVALTTLSNEKLFVVFQGVSNVAGGKSSNSGIKYIASYNAFLAATKFINSIPTPRLACE
ncbi:hypothetical protein OIU84_017406 [Salix udensis]|uniref:Uncharacterized protein n=1 Tax=Salix udensis TaxID=889485 RepID=A0AAD6L1W9_9ROSI|nr:hypothetical protein OIU84_017406 [Salix udensis]